MAAIASDEDGMMAKTSIVATISNTTLTVAAMACDHLRRTTPPHRRDGSRGAKPQHRDEFAGERHL